MLPTRSGHAAASLVALFAAAPSGCGDSAAIDITFVPDLNLNTPAQIVESVGRIRLVADADPPLYPPGTELRGGRAEVFDEDGDQLPELVAAIEIGDSARLPVVRLEQGGLAPDAPFRLVVTGFARAAEAEARAAGAVEGIDFTHEGVRALEMPFNIQNRYLPPRVIQAGPVSNTPGPIRAVLVVFSKPMEISSLRKDRGTIAVVKLEGGRETLVPASDIQITVLPGDEQPTYALYLFGAPLLPGGYRVDVTTEARDESPDRRNLDQVPMQPGNQGFRSRVFIAAAASVETPQREMATASRGSLGGAFAAPSSRPCTDCPAGTSCQPQLEACLPVSCPESCGEGLVCHPDWNICVLDSRARCSAGSRCAPWR